MLLQEIFRRTRLGGYAFLYVLHKKHFFICLNCTHKNRALKTYIIQKNIKRAV